MLLKIPYEFKKSYGGTLEPQTPQDAPWLHGTPLRKKITNSVVLLVTYCMGQAIPTEKTKLFIDRS